MDDLSPVAFRALTYAVRSGRPYRVTVNDLQGYLSCNHGHASLVLSELIESGYIVTFNGEHFVDFMRDLGPLEKFFERVGPVSDDKEQIDFIIDFSRHPSVGCDV